MMTPTSLNVRNLARLLILAGMLALMSSCQTAQLGQPGQGAGSGQANKPHGQASGEILGTAPVRVALLLPLSAPGNAGIVGKQLANAAKLAWQDFGQDTIQLVIKDTAGQAATAQSAAREAVRESSSIVLGPLFSGSVSAASAMTLPAKISMIAFSSDPRRARRGVYLMSFSPQADVSRTLGYAFSRGDTAIIALLPKGAYGSLVETTMREVLGQNGVTLLALEKYDRSDDSINQAARAISASARDATTIYIPDGGKIPSVVIAALKRAGVNVGGKLVLGSGQWESTNFADKNLNGAVFAGRDKRKFAEFAERYKAAYGDLPPSTAGLAYDAVSMAAGLARRYGSEAFDFDRLESRNGYSGVNGIFRFESSGKAERGLALYQVENGTTREISQAPTTFSSGS